MKNNTFIMIAINIILINYLFAQSEKIEHVNLIQLNHMEYENYEISFKDSITGRIINKFELKENNPYNKLNFLVKSQNTIGNVYILNSFQVKELLSNRAKYNKDWNIKADTTYIAESEFEFTKNNNYCMVTYNLKIYIEGGGLKGVNSSILLLDNTGQVKKQYDNLGIDVRTPIISDDGNYFCFVYGGPIDENFNVIIEQGYRIYNIHSGVLLLDKIIVGKDLLSPITNNNFFIFCLEDSNYLRTYIFYDLLKKKAYSKDYTRKEIEWFGGVAQNRSGILFFGQDYKIKKIDIFNKEFKTENF